MPFVVLFEALLTCVVATILRAMGPQPASCKCCAMCDTGFRARLSRRNTMPPGLAVRHDILSALTLDDSVQEYIFNMTPHLAISVSSYMLNMPPIWR